MTLINYFRDHPIRTGLLLMVGYLIYFLTPGMFESTSFGRGHGIETAKDMDTRLLPEIGLTASILIAVAILGWWKPCGFTLKFNKGGIKFVLLPFFFTLFILGYVVTTTAGANQTIVSVVGGQALFTVIVVTMLVGIFEETLFRGIVFVGWERRFGPFIALLVSSLIFGAFHFANWATGQPFPETLTQVIHAFYLGIMYAALRLRIGSILPVIFLHGFWDATITIMGSASASLAVAHSAKSLADAPIAEGSSALSFLFTAIEPTYGLFVLWRWHVWRKRQSEV